MKSGQEMAFSHSEEDPKLWQFMPYIRKLSERICLRKDIGCPIPRYFGGT